VEWEVNGSGPFPLRPAMSVYLEDPAIPCEADSGSLDKPMAHTSTMYAENAKRTRMVSVVLQVGIRR
jgi:hypothetical protein